MARFFRHQIGRPPHPDVLTPAEWRVLALIRERRTNREIAEALGVSVNTVRTHVSSMLAKLDLPDREALATWEGQPAPESRAALHRRSVAPLWLAERVRRRLIPFASGIAVVIVAALFLVAREGAGGDATETATPSPAASATAAAERSTPSPTPFVPLVAPRPGYPSAAPTPGAPTVGLDGGGLPAGATGPLTVYAKEVAGTSHRLEVVVFDLGAEAKASSFTVEANSSIYVGLAETRVIANFGHELWSYALDGSDAQLLLEARDSRFGYFSPSPDGRHVAITTEGGAESPAVWLIEIQSGRVIQRFSLLDDVEEWAGSPSFPGWASNEAVIVAGLCNCDVVVDPPLPAALLDVDGAAEIVPADAPRVDQLTPTDPGITFVCDGERRPATGTGDWLQPVPWMDPAGFGEPFGFTSAECDGRNPLVDMEIVGIPVDTAATGYRVLGFLTPE
jgi:DNA-binding CsgD family transcriptional regulator